MVAGGAAAVEVAGASTTLALRRGRQSLKIGVFGWPTRQPEDWGVRVADLDSAIHGVHIGGDRYRPLAVCLGALTHQSQFPTLTNH